MQVPNTNPHPEGNPEHDPHITQGRFNELKKEIEELKSKLEYSQSEVARLAQLGDFSENVEYSLAKGRLRWLNRRILELESQIHRAEIIKPTKNSTKVELGHKVKIKIMLYHSEESKSLKNKSLTDVQDDRQKQDDSENIKTYTILGPAEVNPEKNIISYLSPVGSALIGKKLGEKFKINLFRSPTGEGGGGKEKEIEVLNIF